MSNRTENAIVDVADGLIVPEGFVTVEFRNERGKVVDREVHQPNFIAKTWKAYARALLRTRWMYMDYNRQFTGQTAAAVVSPAWPYLKSTVPVLPVHGIGCWNQVSAEDSTNEHTAVVPATGLVAWASRWPFGSSTGSRGNVNTTESLVDDDTVRHVFDWTTSQGNGTFQSVGWLGMGAPGIQLVSAGTQHRGRSVVTITPSNQITGATSLYMGKGYVHTDGLVYHFVRRQSTSGVARIVSFSAATELDDATVGILGVNNDVARTLTNVTGEFSPTSLFTTGDYIASAMGRSGSDTTIFSYQISASAVATHRWGKVVDAATSSTTYNFPTTGFISGCVISTHVYAGCTSDSNIYKLLISDGSTVSTIAIDASVTALCTLAGITTPRIHDITTDGTNLIVIYGQSTTPTGGSWLMVKLDAAGVLQQVYGIVPHYKTSGSQTETAASPYAGTYGYPNSFWNVIADYGPLSSDAATATSAVEDILASSTTITTADGATVYLSSDQLLIKGAQTVHYYDGSIIFQYNSAPLATTAFNSAWYRHGFDLGSRVLLGASKTKLNTQTMKITYDITLPGWF